MKRSEQDAAYLSEVLEAWRGAFASAVGDNMPEFYAATAHRALHDDWTQLRPLLVVLQTMLRINTTFVGQIAYSLQQSIEPSADAGTAAKLFEVSRLLREALHPLAAALEATTPRPGTTDGPGVGRPREPVRVLAPDRGGVRGLLDIATLAGLGTLVGVGVGLGTAVQAARLWWRGAPSSDEQALR